MEIKQYDFSSRVEFAHFIKKYKMKKRLDTLNNTSLVEGKKIFLVLERGFFKKYKIIGYTIINEKVDAICIVNKINEEYCERQDVIYISDFMIDYLYQNQGNGKILANYIINDIYKDKDIILQPDGDGNWFWKELGFVNDEISKHLTLILKRKDGVK
ncbi:MAG: hypothetical protein HFJ27_04455 [Clostridia bacterium]|nr:hypothetical protein [Clostridia bacterium]